jgi:protein CpxP
MNHLTKTVTAATTLCLLAFTIPAFSHQSDNNSGLFQGDMMMDTQKLSGIHRQMRENQSLMERIRNEQDPSTRDQMMQQHMDSMHKQMETMNRMMGSENLDSSPDDMGKRMDSMNQRMNMMQMMMNQMTEHQNLDHIQDN